MKMSFRGDGRVVILLKGESWIVPSSMKILMRGIKGLKQENRSIKASHGYIEPWFVEEGYAISDISFLSGQREYSIEEYSQRTGIEFGVLLSERYKIAREEVESKQKERVSIPRTGLASLFGE